MSPHPLIGTPAPSLSLINHDGEKFDFQPGVNPAAVFFYPKAGSYACAREACSFRDALENSELFKNAKIQVVGISPDAVEKQARFVQKQMLNFPVLSDPHGEARRVYKVGKGLFGLTEGRVTFVIDSSGVVRDVLDARFNFNAHVKFVTKWLNTMPTKEATTQDTETEQAPAFAAAGEEEGDGMPIDIERVSDQPPQL